MGMYNEVFTPCRTEGCAGYAMTQVAEYVRGFGEFRLDRPETMLELTDDQLQSLKDELKDCWFGCCVCGHSFRYFNTEKHNAERGKKIAAMFDPNGEG